MGRQDRLFPAHAVSCFRGLLDASLGSASSQFAAGIRPDRRSHTTLPSQPHRYPGGRGRRRTDRRRLLGRSAIGEDNSLSHRNRCRTDSPTCPPSAGVKRGTVPQTAIAGPLHNPWVDRLDYTKGVGQRLLTFEYLLEHYPALGGSESEHQDIHRLRLDLCLSVGARDRLGPACIATDDPAGRSFPSRYKWSRLWRTLVLRDHR